jgi:hypothetical protein
MTAAYYAHAKVQTETILKQQVALMFFFFEIRWECCHSLRKKQKDCSGAHVLLRSFFFGNIW